MKLTRLRTYFRVWRLNASNTLQKLFINRATNILFFFGKTVRMGMSLLFIFLIKDQISSFSSYSIDQVVIFFLTYQFIDTLTQVFFRGVYMFRARIIRGTFDFMLLKPISPLFQALTDHPDINDTIFIIPTTLLSIYIATTLNISITWQSLLAYLILVANGLMIATALHILVLVSGIITKDIQGFIWIYRDLLRLSRFPVTIYLQPLRGVLFFVIPVGMMVTIPAEVLLNLTPSHSIAMAFMTGIGSLLVSLKIWQWSLKKYSSASS